MKFKRFLVYAAIVLAVNLLLFLPFVEMGLIENFFSSLELYFKKFEFNASIYYMVRAVGFETVGWNIIQTAGPVLGVIVFIIALLFTFVPDNSKPYRLMLSSMFLLSIYYFMSTTIMPWYIISILFFGIFSNYRYPLLWTFTIILSYQAYSLPAWKENMWVIGMEYIPVYALLFYELFNKYLPAKTSKQSF